MQIDFIKSGGLRRSRGLLLCRRPASSGRAAPGSDRYRLFQDKAREGEEQFHSQIRTLLAAPLAALLSERPLTPAPCEQRAAHRSPPPTSLQPVLPAKGPWRVLPCPSRTPDPGPRPALGGCSGSHGNKGTLHRRWVRHRRSTLLSPSPFGKALPHRGPFLPALLRSLISLLSCRSARDRLPAAAPRAAGTAKPCCWRGSRALSSLQGDGFIAAEPWHPATAPNPGTQPQHPALAPSPGTWP